MSPAGAIRGFLRRRIGYLRMAEWRNKVLLGPAAVRARRFEDDEVARLRPLLGGSAPVAVATIIATYRRPESLAVAVRSALAQTVQDQIVVVVDDGGGLNLDIDDPRLVTVSLSRNIGIVGVVRNVGIRLTASSYVAFLDDDNSWEPDHLEVAIAAIATGAAMVYTAVRRMWPDGTEMDVLSEAFDRASMARDASPADNNAILVRRTPGLHYSRISRVVGVVPPEDWELVFRTSRGADVRHVPVPTVRYLVNPASYYSAWTADLGADIFAGAGDRSHVHDRGHEGEGGAA